MNQDAEKIGLRQKIRWLQADMDTPISVYLKKINNNNGVLLESAEVDGRWGRYSILAYDMLFLITCEKGLIQLNILDHRFDSLSVVSGRPFMEGMREIMSRIHLDAPQDQPDLPPITRAFYGYLGFGMASVFNPHLQKHMPLEEADCCLSFPGKVIVFDHLYNRLCELSIMDQKDMEVEPLADAPDESLLSAENVKAEPDEEGYKNFVRTIRDQLTHGEAIQVVPSVHFSMPFTGNPFNLYRKMRSYNASPYMFYMKFPHIALFGSSPEVMVRCAEDKLRLSPIAGTRRRGKNDLEDRELAEELLADPKERAEHVMLVDLGRNDLGKIAAPGSVKVEKMMEVERFSHVMHITSSVTADLDKNGRQLDALDVLVATFPAGTVSGAPKFRAMEIIRQLEGRARGPYAGCIGWIGLDKEHVDMDMGITIRSMWVTDGRLHWQAGGGIVHDSDPGLEWKEVCNKSAIMRLALQAANTGGL